MHIKFEKKNHPGQRPGPNTSYFFIWRDKLARKPIHVRLLACRAHPLKSWLQD